MLVHLYTAASVNVLTMCLEMTHTYARHAHKLEVLLILTCQAVVVTHVLLGSLDECSVDLMQSRPGTSTHEQPASLLMSAAAPASRLQAEEHAAAFSCWLPALLM